VAPGLIHKKHSNYSTKQVLSRCYLGLLAGLLKIHKIIGQKNRLLDLGADLDPDPKLFSFSLLLQMPCKYAVELKILWHILQWGKPLVEIPIWDMHGNQC